MTSAGLVIVPGHAAGGKVDGCLGEIPRVPNRFPRCSRRRDAGSGRSIFVSQLLALASAAAYGVADVIGGLITRRYSVWTVIFWSTLLGLPVLVVGLLVVDAPEVTVRDLAWGAFEGVAGVTAVAILYSTMAGGTMSVVAPISGAVAATVPVLVDVSTGETLSPVQSGGIVLAVAGVLLIGLDRAESRIDRKSILRAVAAGTGFALGLIAFGQTGEASGLWPVAAAVSVIIPLTLVMVLLRAPSPAPPVGDLPVLGLAGVFNAGATVAIALSLQRGPLGINSVLVSLYPAVTALVAVVFLKERLSARQAVGITFAMAAVAALA